MTQKYATQNITGAKALLRNAPISTKHAIEIANRIRGKTTARAKAMLQDVVDLKRPIAFTRYNGDVGHKPGMGPGRYPTKAAQHILQLVKSVEANATDNGMDSSSLIITAVVANKAAGRPRYGRQRGRIGKNTHVELIAMPTKEKQAPEKKAKTQPAKKEEAATPAQPAPKAPAPKPEQKVAEKQPATPKPANNDTPKPTQQPKTGDRA